MLNHKGKFVGRDFLTLADFSGAEILQLLDTADEIKANLKKGIPTPCLAGKTLGMIFQKSSTRTRVSFEVGMYQLGGHALFLSDKDIQLGRGECIPDTARVLSRFLDGIMIRTFDQEDVAELARYADIPVINGLTDLTHPCQVLADLQTIREYKGKLKGLKLAYVGDGNNMAHSLMIGGAKVGMDVSIAAPAGYQPAAKMVQIAQEAAAISGCKIEITTDPIAAVTDADVIYTDVWASMGQEDEAVARIKAFAGYQIDGQLVAHAKKDYLFLHCLPAHRGEEVAAEVIDGSNTAVWDEAENRLHAQKAILALLL